MVKMYFLTVLLLITPTFLLASDQAEECNAALNESIKEFLKSDTNNYLGKQYMLTTLKLSKITTQNNAKSFEALIQKKKASLTDPKSEKKLVTLYQTYGKQTDIGLVKAEIVELKKDAEKAEYWNKERRFYNQNSSAFLAAVSVSNPEYQIEEKDIAVTWLMGQVSSEAEKKFGKNGAVHNLTNLSNRIARNTGASGDDAMSASEIDKRVSVLEVNMDQMIQRFKDNFISNNKKCFEGNGPFKGCDFTSQFIEESIAEFFLEVSSRLEKKTDISEVLKGHVGEIYFDISDATAVIAGDARKSVSTASSTNSNEQSKTNKPATLKVKNDSGVKPKHVSNTVGQHSKPSHASKSQTHAKKTDLYLKAKELPHDKLSNGICWGYCAYLYQNPFAPSQFSSTAHSACKKGFELADQNYLSVRMGKTKKTYMSLCEDTKNDHACKMGYKRGISCFIKQDEDPSARIGALKTTFETYEGEYDEYFQPKEYCMQTTKKFTKNREWEVVKTVDASCKQCGMDEPFDPEDMVMGYCD